MSVITKLIKIVTTGVKEAQKDLNSIGDSVEDISTKSEKANKTGKEFAKDFSGELKKLPGPLGTVSDGIDKILGAGAAGFGTLGLLGLAAILPDVIRYFQNMGKEAKEAADKAAEAMAKAAKEARNLRLQMEGVFKSTTKSDIYKASNLTGAYAQDPSVILGAFAQAGATQNELALLGKQIGYEGSLDYSKGYPATLTPEAIKNVDLKGALAAAKLGEFGPPPKAPDPYKGLTDDEKSGYINLLNAGVVHSVEEYKNWKNNLGGTSIQDEMDYQALLDGLTAQAEAGFITPEVGPIDMPNVDIKLPTYWEELGQAMKDVAEQAQTTGQIMTDAISGATERMGEAITRFVMTGKLNFRDLISSLIQMIVQMLMQQAVLKFVAWFGGMFLGAGAGGASAYGVGGSMGAANIGGGMPAAYGDEFVHAGDRMIVGDKGRPEMFVAPSDGKIVGSDQMGGAVFAPQISMNIGSVDSNQRAAELQQQTMNIVRAEYLRLRAQERRYGVA